MKNMMKVLFALVLLAPAYGSHAQGFATGLMLGSSVSSGPSKEQINDMIQDELGRREAMKHETLLETGLAKGSTLEITRFIGELRTRRNSYNGKPEARLRTNHIELNDPKLGPMTCGTYANSEDSFWHCKPLNPANPLMYTASWEPYFVPKEPINPAWGETIQVEPVTLGGEPVQYSRYLLLFVRQVSLKDEDGNLFVCPTVHSSYPKCELMPK